MIRTKKVTGFYQKKKRKKRVIELYLEGIPYNQIAKIVRISIRDISSIINEYLGIQKANPEKSNRSKAFLMIKENKLLVDVVIEFDILPSEAEQIHPYFLKLEGRDFVNKNFDQVEKDIPGFVKYHDVMKKYEQPEKHNIKLTVDNIFVLEQQKDEYHKTLINHEKLSDFKYQLEIDIQKLKTQYEFYMS
ncbi:MAG: hypothetical protein P0116_00185 [Candidatus Nitrosocosmicus sp.]|nr:hypothetical protein [Candidatus Nitrosocosmicus sp.]